jgi:hypothetical protein
MRRGMLKTEKGSDRMPTCGEKERKEVMRLPDENDPDNHDINSSAWTCTEPESLFPAEGHHHI